MTHAGLPYLVEGSVHQSWQKKLLRIFRNKDRGEGKLTMVDRRQESQLQLRRHKNLTKRLQIPTSSKNTKIARTYQKCQKYQRLSNSLSQNHHHGLQNHCLLPPIAFLKQCRRSPSILPSRIKFCKKSKPLSTYMNAIKRSQMALNARRSKPHC